MTLPGRRGRHAAAVAAGVLAFALGARPAAAAAVPAAPVGLRPAQALLVYNRDTGTVVFARNAGAELPIASLSKLMTAYVTVERFHAATRFVERPYTPQPDESVAGIPAGDRLDLTDMLRGMLLPSGNDVANSLAVDVGQTTGHFVALMNFWSGLLRLGRTHFTTPVGLDTPGNYSTAVDLARLTDVLLRDPLVAKVVKERAARLADGVVVHNTNRVLAHHRWVVGVKTGHTPEAGYCLVGAAHRNGVNIISVVLGAPTAAASDVDTLALLRFGLDRFRRVPIARAGRTYATLAVAGRRRTDRLIATRSLALVVDRSVTVRAALIVPRRLVGPLPAGAAVGAIDVSENGRRVAVVRLVTAAAVPAPASAAQTPARLAPPASRRLAWIIVGCGLTVFVAGCSLLVMRRRVARSSLG
jgi:D-alanyl-D-alanine carboxypeptidase